VLYNKSVGAVPSLPIFLAKQVNKEGGVEEDIIEENKEH
jgi:hypothetical protein